MLGHGFCEGGAAANARQEVGRDGAQLRIRRQIFEDHEGAVQREPGLHKGAELMGEREDVPPTDATPAEPRPAESKRRATFALGSDLDGEVGVPLEALDDAPRVGRLHDALDGLAPPVCCAIREGRHAGPQLSSWVTRRISSTVVNPARALAQASSLRVTMPLSTAMRRISPVDALRRIRLRISSVMMNSS